MSASTILRQLTPGFALVVTAGLLAVAPAEADPTGHTSWVTRDDARDPSASTTYTWAGSGLPLQVDGGLDRVSVLTDHLRIGLSATFIAPAGQTLQAGSTYLAEAVPGEPTAGVGRLLVWRDGKMCGRTWEQLFRFRPAPTIATGSFHVNEIERDAGGAVTRFSATFELNCVYLDALGTEGSVAVNATAPAAPLPAAPVTPAAVTGLAAANVGPNRVDDTVTTLTWTNPAGADDLVVDMSQTEHPDRLPPGIGVDPGSDVLYRGNANRYRATRVEFMDTRTYRVTPRGPTGRLGVPTLVTVLGTRLSIPDGATERITIGRTVRFAGRLSMSWDYEDPDDVMKGPGIVGSAVVLCRYPSDHYIDSPCTEVDRARTTVDGRFSLTATPDANSIYDVVVPATTGHVANVARLVVAEVAPQTDLTVIDPGVAPTSTARVATRRSRVIHFSTSRARAGASGLVRLQRLDGRRWRTIATRNLGSGRGRLVIPYIERRSGAHAYRVVKVADVRHVNGYSRVVHVRVR